MTSTARRLALLLAVLLLGSPRARAEDEAPFEEQVNAAIDRGVEWLKSIQKDDGSYPGLGEHLPANTYNPMDVGLNALVVQTLVHCGVDPDDDAIKKCLRFCRFHYAGGRGSWNLKGNGRVMVYTAATLILALDAVHNGKVPPPEVRHDRYGNPVPPKPSRCRMPASVKAWIKELVEFLVGCQASSGGWRYPGNPVDSVEADTDISNTQYALLALDAAARCGIDAPVETWTRAVDYLLREQEEDGLDVPVWIPNAVWSEDAPDDVPRFLEGATTTMRGWAYLPGHVALATGSMTCAGTTCLAVAKERLWAREALPEALSKRIDKGVLDGVAWLGDHFTVTDNPDPPNQWHFYYLYGLERTGSKTGLEFLGKHDWYREGATYLLGAQEESGGWKEADRETRLADEAETHVTNTCFALLFLKRSTRKPVIPVAPPALTGG